MDNMISLNNIDYSKSLGICIFLTNVKTSSKMKFVYINYSYDNIYFINYLLSKLNEINIKKKKEISSIKKKNLTSGIKNILKELGFDNNLYYAMFLDLSSFNNDFNSEEFKEILFNI